MTMNIYEKASDAWDNLPSRKQDHLESFCTGYITAYAEFQQEIADLKEQLAFEKGKGI